MPGCGSDAARVPWRRSLVARVAAAVALALAVSACSGPFFYRDVIVPTDPNRKPAAQPAP